MATDVPTNEKGEFVKPPSAFRDWITADGSSGFAPENDRYHLYISLACPWAHRTMMGRALKGIEEVIPITVVDWYLTEKGWSFCDDKPRCSLDTVNGKDTLREVYQIAEPGYDGRCSVPVLWDKQKKTVVSNESAEILRMFNAAFSELSKTPAQKELDLYPDNLKAQIDEINDWVYPMVNNGVYRAGFATTQEAYDSAVKDVFDGLDKVEGILSKNRYLCGKDFTEADVRLFTTLIRFDTVYNGHFKCCRNRLVDFPNTWAYTREIYQMPGVAETCDQDHIRNHYMRSQENVNPSGIVAASPEIDYNEPHGRDKAAGAKSGAKSGETKKSSSCVLL